MPAQTLTDRGCINSIVTSQVIEPNVIHRFETCFSNLLHDGMTSSVDGLVLGVHDTFQAAFCGEIAWEGGCCKGAGEEEDIQIRTYFDLQSTYSLETIRYHLRSSGMRIMI